MKSLLREFVRHVLAEVDVLPPEKDPRQQGLDAPKSTKKTSQATQSSQKVGPSQSYQEKEKTREKLQQVVAQKVRNGQLSRDEDIQKFLDNEEDIRSSATFSDDEDVSLAATALRGVPLSVWKQLR